MRLTIYVNTKIVPYLHNVVKMVDARYDRNPLQLFSNTEMAINFENSRQHKKFIIAKQIIEQPYFCGLTRQWSEQGCERPRGRNEPLAKRSGDRARRGI